MDITYANYKPRSTKKKNLSFPECAYIQLALPQNSNERRGLSLSIQLNSLGWKVQLEKVLSSITWSHPGLGRVLPRKTSSKSNHSEDTTQNEYG